MKTTIRRTESTTLHFNLASFKEDPELVFHVALNDFPIQPHTRKTLLSHAKINPLLEMVPVTHYIERVPLPSNAVAMMHVTKSVRVGKATAHQVLSMAIHVPRAGRRKFLGSHGPAATPNPKLLRY